MQNYLSELLQNKMINKICISMVHKYKCHSVFICYVTYLTIWCAVFPVLGLTDLIYYRNKLHLL